MVEYLYHDICILHLPFYMCGQNHQIPKPPPCKHNTNEGSCVIYEFNWWGKHSFHLQEETICICYIVSNMRFAELCLFLTLVFLLYAPLHLHLHKMEFCQDGRIHSTLLPSTFSSSTLLLLFWLDISLSCLIILQILFHHLHPHLHALTLYSIVFSLAT